MKEAANGFLIFLIVFGLSVIALPLPANLGSDVQNTYLWRVKPGKC